MLMMERVCGAVEVDNGSRGRLRQLRQGDEGVEWNTFTSKSSLRTPEARTLTAGSTVKTGSTHTHTPRRTHRHTLTCTHPPSTNKNRHYLRQQKPRWLESTQDQVGIQSGRAAARRPGNSLRAGKLAGRPTTLTPQVRTV